MGVPEHFGIPVEVVPDPGAGSHLQSYRCPRPVDRPLPDALGLARPPSPLAWSFPIMTWTVARARGARGALVGLCAAAPISLALPAIAREAPLRASAEPPPSGAIISLPLNEGTGTIA